MIKGVIFDMDGVLVDNRDVHIEAFEIYARRKGLRISMDKLLEAFGMGNNEIFPIIMERDDISAEELTQLGDEKEAVYREIYKEKIVPTRGLHSFVELLKSRGIKMAVGSSGSNENVEFVLAMCGLDNTFDAIANGDHITRAKPDPEVFLLAAERLGLKPEECLVFEDSFAGIAAARSAGMKVVAVATTFPRERHSDYDAIIDDFTQADASLLNLN